MILRDVQGFTVQVYEFQKMSREDSCFESEAWRVSKLEVFAAWLHFLRGGEERAHDIRILRFLGDWENGMPRVAVVLNCQTRLLSRPAWCCPCGRVV